MWQPVAPPGEEKLSWPQAEGRTDYEDEREQWENNWEENVEEIRDKFLFLKEAQLYEYKKEA